MRSLPALIASAAVVALTALPARAQTREGFYVGGGIGRGSAVLTADSNCQLCRPFSTGRKGGLTADLRLGQSLGPHVGLEVDLNRWFHLHDPPLYSFSNASLAVSFHPGHSGFFVKAGPGLARLALKQSQTMTLSNIKVGFTAGVGYDVPIGRTTAVSPMATYWWGNPGTPTFDDIGGPVDVGYRYNVLELSVGVTFY